MIAVLSRSVESHSKACPLRLARYANVDGLTVNRNNVKFGQSGGGEPGELGGAFGAGHGEIDVEGAAPLYDVSCDDLSRAREESTCKND